MPSSDSSPKIAIIGGGIAGLALGSALLKRGVKDFQVYERGVADDVLRQGYHIRCAQEGIDALRDILDPAIFAQLVTKFSHGAAHAPVLVDPKTAEPLLYLSHYASYPNSLPISRYALRGALAKRVEQAGKIAYEKQFDRIEVADEKTQRLRVHFKDGSSTEADIVIAADGSRSPLHVALGLPETATLPQWTNLSYRTKLSTEMYARLGHVLRDERVAGMSAYQGHLFAALYHHPDRSELNYADEAPPAKTSQTQAHEEAGRGEHIFWAYSIPRDVVPFDPAKTPQDYYDILTQHLRDHPERYHPSHLAIVEFAKNEVATCQASQFRASVQPDAAWRERTPRSATDLNAHPRVFFVGDAMHSMPPGRGYGANSSFLDCAKLAPVLIDLLSSGKIGDTQAVRTANIAYENEMIPRGFSWVEASMRAFNLDTASWVGAIGWRVFRAFHTVAHYLITAGVVLHLRPSTELRL